MCSADDHARLLAYIESIITAFRIPAHVQGDRKARGANLSTSSPMVGQLLTGSEKDLVGAGAGSSADAAGAAGAGASAGTPSDAAADRAAAWRSNVRDLDICDLAAGVCSIVGSNAFEGVRAAIGLYDVDDNGAIDIPEVPPSVVVAVAAAVRPSARR